MVYLFLANGFEEIEAVATIDTLRRAEVKLTTVSITSDLFVTGAHNIILKADNLFYELDFSDADMLILPGGMPGTSSLFEFKPLIELLTRQNEQSKWIAAICAAPLVIGRLGILNGKTAACYPSFEPELVGANVIFDSSVISGNIITSRGPGCAVDFACDIIKSLNPNYDIISLRKAMIVE